MFQAAPLTPTLVREFGESDLALDKLLASACLPKMHQALEIDGATYWDGGESAIPAAFPLFCDCDASDVRLVLLVLLSRLERDDTPCTVEEVEARIVQLAVSRACPAP